MDASRRTYGGVGSERDGSREELLELGLPLVRRMAFRMARRLPANVEVDDLIGAGMEGLVKAVDAYDSSKYPRFEPYAKARIRGAILDELRSADSLTRYGRSRLGEVTRTIRQLQHDLDRAPTDEEIAKALDMPLEQYQRMAGDLVRGPALGGAFGVSPEEVESSSPDPSRVYDQAEMRSRLAHGIRGLPERQQQVLALYYQEECTQAEIGEILGVTESRVCQILGEATLRLRATMGVDDDNRHTKVRPPKSQTKSHGKVRERTGSEG